MRDSVLKWFSKNVNFKTSSSGRNKEGLCHITWAVCLQVVSLLCSDGFLANSGVT
jgi:hypothetical protein